MRTDDVAEKFGKKYRFSYYIGAVHAVFRIRATSRVAAMTVIEYRESCFERGRDYGIRATVP